MNSIVVKEGDKVRANDLIGSAGNSGWTERPHLHMQLINSVSDNSVRFKDMNLYKNRLVKI